VRQIPKSLESDAKPRRILEVGPGTGAFTDQIIRRMNPNDTLHLVEFDEDFCKLLIEKYKDIPNVTVFHQSITDFESEKYDFIVSGLPMNAFTPNFVKAIFNRFEDLSKEGTKISYFEYMVLPQIKQLFSKKADRISLQSILNQKKEFYHKHPLTTDHVLTNITPAQVKHHQVKT
jgi:phospholipid N-methyltransferase